MRENPLLHLRGPCRQKRTKPEPEVRGPALRAAAAIWLYSIDRSVPGCETKYDCERPGQLRSVHLLCPLGHRIQGERAAGPRAQTTAMSAQCLRDLCLCSGPRETSLGFSS